MTGQLLVPIPDSCARLGNIGRTTLYELVNGGKLTKVNIGTRSFITAESIEQFVNALASKTASDDGAVSSDGAA